MEMNHLKKHMSFQGRTTTGQLMQDMLRQCIQDAKDNRKVVEYTQHSNMLYRSSIVFLGRRRRPSIPATAEFGVTPYAVKTAPSLMWLWPPRYFFTESFIAYNTSLYCCVLRLLFSLFPVVYQVYFSACSWKSSWALKCSQHHRNPAETAFLMKSRSST